MNSFSVDYLPAVPDWAITFAGVKKREQNSTRVWKTFMIVYWYRVWVLHKQDYEWTLWKRHHETVRMFHSIIRICCGSQLLVVLKLCQILPDQIQQYRWPIVKKILSYLVNLVRQNIEWSIPILLKSYGYNNCLMGKENSSLASKFSADACNEVYAFLKATLLNNKLSPNKITSCGAFSKRQSYCRILSSVALIWGLKEKRILTIRRTIVVSVNTSWNCRRLMLFLIHGAPLLDYYLSIVLLCE